MSINFRETAQKSGKPENQNNGKVNINGKEYLTVAYRLAAFRKQYPIESGWSLATEHIQCDEKKVVFKATIYHPNGQIVATGHAEEKRDDSFINRTNALENAETSAIGRALASAGFIGSEFASADEVAQAIQAQGSQATLPAKLEKPSEAQSQAEQEALPAKALHSQSEMKAQVEQSLATKQAQHQATNQPDEQKAEQWAKEHLAQWLDSSCPFAKAQGRTWRELAENKGNKITVNGKASAPRAYLHALEGWKDCKVWQRMKAKVVLAVIESSNGNHSQLAEAKI